MPIPVPEALDDSAVLAEAKAQQVRRLPKYMVNAAFAGAYVGVAVVLLLSVAGPLAAGKSPATKLVQGSVFGIALTLVVFAGAELFTGNVMYMLQGLAAGTVTAGELAAVWAASLFGNLVGSLGFAAMVNAGGTMATGAAPGKLGPAEALVKSIVDAKNAATGGQLFWRSVLCNALVCLALWMAGRTRSDAGKLVVLWWALFAFIASGFEHSVANMTLFGLGIFEGHANWGDLFRNLAWTVPGNIVGGGLLIGLGYAYAGRTARSGPTADVAAAVVPSPVEQVPVLAQA
ncbi:MAG TPA: formate/nitrite transporter family protein [Acidimicrobiales bacterium]|jgi:nitrite transporter NirC|nr:formate/nitrite transporter family protein [Acidimicrobiales bacterium]